MLNPTPAIRIQSLSKTFGNGRRALDGVDLTVQEGEMIALIGASGSGKSTLLRHIAGLSAGDADGLGTVEVFGRVAQANGQVSRDIRSIRTGVGMVFQQFNLVDRLPVIVNVLTGMLARMPRWRRLTGWFSHADIASGQLALARVGIAECAQQRASTLSGGQQQRAAIARTLVQKARIILADEPIASLDPESSRRVMEILTQINRTERNTVVVTLHQIQVAMTYCPRVVALNAGRVVFDGPAQSLTPALLRQLYGTQAEALLHPDAPVPPAAHDQNPAIYPPNQGIDPTTLTILAA